MTSRWRRDDTWTVLAARQCGLLATAQLREWGWTDDDIRRPVDSGHWRRLGGGVLATTTTPATDRHRVWRGVLATGGMACGMTSLRLAGLTSERRNDPPERVEIAVDWGRRAGTVADLDVDVHRHRELRGLRLPNSSPPRVRPEVAALEVCGRSTDAERVVGLVLSVVQQRVCRAEALAARLRACGRHPWRVLINELLVEVEAGSLSPLEVRYARGVERAHGLPVAVRNRDLQLAGGALVVDALYAQWGVVVELDGRLAHPSHLAFRDQRRDNRAVTAGFVPLRFGWRDVVGRPCEVAAQVASVLTSRGWDGAVRPCGPSCPA